MSLRVPVQDARTLLFVPGNRPDRFEKAARSGADAIVLDLEDSVPCSEKDVARANIVNHWDALRASNTPVIVRINALSGTAWMDDLTAICGMNNLAAVMISKAETPESLRCVWDKVGVPLLPLIETVRGFRFVELLAATPGVTRLVIGHVDFMVDSGISCGDDEAEIAPLRYAVAMATRLAGLASAVDGVTVQISDDERLRSDTRRALRYGFGGKLCIHPQQVAVVHETLRPTAHELDWARRVIAVDEASRGAAVQLDGQMVDLPVVLRAKRTLARAACGSDNCDHQK
jgi:citrate lyase subunit beta/citryl-CoA lyase